MGQASWPKSSRKGIGVYTPTLLGYIVSQHGAEVNPEKVSAIARMGLFRDVKGVQKVTVAWRR